MFKGLILIDNDQVDYSLDLIAVVNRLAQGEAFIYGLGINLPEEVKGLDALINVEGPSIQLKDSRVMTDIIEQVHREYQFDSIIILATEFGRMVAPRVAMRLGVGLVADITDIHVDKRGKKLVRPAFSGNIMASIVCETSPIMASVHPNVFHAEDLTKMPEKIDFYPTELKASSIEILDINESEHSGIDIREADVIISAGGGFSEPIDQLQGLADELSGVVAVSKQLVDRKRAPREIQVGQSGKTVSPDLYLALGIYGSTQHIEGLKNVKEIISVNTDLGAPMNHLASIVVHGDAAEFARKLSTRLKG
ncbi:electron transfer flavoprotein subunit alpha/FixB family protein [Enterococcus raffinosus]|uniref:Electron transfer flavoprotein subunit alpha/FixB family protein n=1 Tax=Enterococcus raffinosus TaxID=71452 RepID=A0AAW8SYD2_9ENTE|nr:electron transfer flavoprotein subunit alpha/FixB family protein [Enterococcus raffinosus]MBS6431336.1 electron transfer flavoprotein subunit alpha/FixB family protein [Enterococcus raffinosus]MDK7991041.1 electron transfer flavoprotein subunit alpha/FixB family protein [Enterococcus raffinosus]MDT2539161.1 electron transfer flavoprotein subunit alpha/FixB family protein [Enterococcus raffinosus]MDT2573794.1 electron transfer flavoprotein subunit alpha/FixB family protein [Enterococcus raffi